jgi:hypothetical protein
VIYNEQSRVKGCGSWLRVQFLWLKVGVLGLRFLGVGARVWGLRFRGFRI